jgi:hypothetical protein
MWLEDWIAAVFLGAVPIAGGLLAVLIGIAKRMADLERHHGVNVSELRDDLAAGHRRLAYLCCSGIALYPATRGLGKEPASEHAPHLPAFASQPFRYGSPGAGIESHSADTSHGNLVRGYADKHRRRSGARRCNTTLRSRQMPASRKATPPSPA